MNIEAVLDSLARKRPIFHNEADFQHALAWEIREMYECKIRLERRMDIDLKRRTYLDILVERDGRKTAIELKYKMRAVEHTLEGETFSILNHGAQDIGRYDVLKDLQRIEQMVNNNLVHDGYLVFLTNDLLYYTDPGIEKWTADRDFRIHEGREISGTLFWSESAGEGTMKGREEPIVIEGTYKFSWHDYSKLEHSSRGSIKALNIHVNSERLKGSRPVEATIIAPKNEPRVVIPNEIKENTTELRNLVKSIDTIPVSQADLKVKLAEHLAREGYQVQINREFDSAKVDIWAEKGNDHIAIEVLYKTALLQTIHNGTSINLKKHGAYPEFRYDYLKNMETLETVVSQRSGTKGYAILITNDHNYWVKSIRISTVDEDFRIHQGRVVQGELFWKNASDGTMQNREKAIDIKGEYLLDWKPFITLGTGKNEIFQMLVLEVSQTRVDRS